MNVARRVEMLLDADVVAVMDCGSVEEVSRGY